MKIKMFVNWDSEEIMTKAEADATLASKLGDKADYEDYRGTYFNDIIEEWLDEILQVHSSEYYTKIFDLTAEQRAELEAKCRESFEEQVKADFFNDWEEIEIEV